MIATLTTPLLVTATENHSGAIVPKCSHGVYRPYADHIALNCQQCNPDGTGTGESPVLPRSSADPLNADRNEKLEACECGMIRTFSSDECVVCGKPFPDDSNTGRSQGTANPHAAGVCPGCGSTVHYEGKTKKQWVCADCDTTYAAPKRTKHE